MSDLANSIYIILILLPGFLSQRIFAIFRVESSRISKSDFEKIMEAAAFSFINLIIFLILSLIWKRIAVIFFKISSNNFIEIDFISLLYFLIIVILTGFIVGIIYEKGWFYSFLRKCKLVKKTGYPDVWTSIFRQYEGAWLIVRLKNGIQIRGWAKYYSDDGEGTPVFLVDTIVYDVDGNEKYVFPSMLLPNKEDIESIILYHEDIDKEIGHKLT